MGQYDIIVVAGLAGDRTKVSIAYRELIINEPIAQGAASMLEDAIAYLLSIDAWKPAEPDSKEFIDQTFHAPATKDIDTGGSNKGLPMALWHKKIMSSEAGQYPLLPYDHYSQVDKAACVGMDDLYVNGDSGVSETRERRPPATAKEQRLQELLATVLKVETASIDLEDSFLDLGGDSMIAMQLVGVARGQGLSLQVANIFRYPRLRNLAYHISERENVIHTDPVPFSLLDIAAQDVFISQEVPPLVQEKTGIIKDILPLSYFQETVVHLALHAPSRLWGYFSIDLPPTIDVSTVSTSCMTLVNHFDILRSVFIQARGRYFQVVLENLHLPIDSYQENVDIDPLSHRIVKEDLERPVVLGRSFIRIMILRGCSGDVRIVLRLFHAQYDATSFGQIMNALSALYEGRQLAKPRTYANYLQFVKTQTPSAYDYWRSILHGSLLVHLPQPQTDSSETLDNASLVVVENSIPALAATRDATPANIFTAACAIMLRKISKSDDFVFGRLVSGRAGLPTHLQDIVGPCLNAVPVRVQAPSNQTDQDILSLVQKQYIEGIPHEAALTDEMVRSCGDYPENALRCRFYTRYENYDEHPGTEIAGFFTRMNLIKRKAGAVPGVPGTSINATPRGSSLDLSLSGSSQYIDQEMAERMLAEVCHALTSLQG